MQKVALFDIDGTLIGCLSQKILADDLAKKKMLSNADKVKIIYWSMLYKLGLIQDSTKIRKEVYSVFTKKTHAYFDELFDQLGQSIAKDFARQEMLPIVEKHREQGDRLIAISGSIFPLCKPISDHFQISHLYATKLIMKENRYSGEWEGPILESQHKVELVNKLANEFGFRLDDATAYADSYADIDMLKAVGNPIAVFPDRKLRNFAQLRGWKIIDN